ncbi:hypothetical protein H0H92_015669 [Tricholoma furcatifolium]|nr:hypothetical protein H0H92_015669 [Tricholoma furcatifolium]
MSRQTAWKNILNKDGDQGMNPSSIPLDILHYRTWEQFEEPKQVLNSPVDLASLSFIQGSWSGYCGYEGLFRLSIDGYKDDDGSISGKADSYVGSLALGLVIKATEPNSAEKYVVHFVMEYDEDGFGIRWRGTLDPASATITGQWFTRRSPDDPRPPIIGHTESEGTPNGTFRFSRTPASFVRFRYTQEEFKKHKARARCMRSYPVPGLTR